MNNNNIKNMVGVSAIAACLVFTGCSSDIDNAKINSNATVSMKNGDCLKFTYNNGKFSINYNDGYSASESICNLAEDAINDFNSKSGSVISDKFDFYVFGNEDNSCTFEVRGNDDNKLVIGEIEEEFLLDFASCFKFDDFALSYYNCFFEKPIIDHNFDTYHCSGEIMDPWAPKISIIESDIRFATSDGGECPASIYDMDFGRPYDTGAGLRIYGSSNPNCLLGWYNENASLENVDLYLSESNWSDSIDLSDFESMDVAIDVLGDCSGTVSVISNENTNVTFLGYGELDNGTTTIDINEGKVVDVRKESKGKALTRKK